MMMIIIMMMIIMMIINNDDNNDNTNKKKPTQNYFWHDLQEFKCLNFKFILSQSAGVLVSNSCVLKRF